MKQKESNYEDMENTNKLQDEMIKEGMRETIWTNAGMCERK